MCGRVERRSTESTKVLQLDRAFPYAVRKSRPAEFKLDHLLGKEKVPGSNPGVGSSTRFERVRSGARGATAG
jgi:hypothetical protein